MTDIKACDISKIPVRREKDAAAVADMTKNVSITCGAQPCIGGSLHIKAHISQKNDEIPVDAVIGKDVHVIAGKGPFPGKYSVALLQV